MKNIFSIKLFLLLILIKNIRNNLCNGIFKFFKKQKSVTIEEPLLNIFIVTHKDFKNYRYNPVYKIIANDPSKLRDKYDLEVLYCDENSKLKDMDVAYGEISKFYHVYNLYKSGKMSSQYVGFNHYRRYFSFLDDIPDLDKIFKKYDVILTNQLFISKRNHSNLRSNYCKYHLCRNYDEMIEIIKDKRPEFYEAAIEASNMSLFYSCNMFIMKKRDFINYCEFMFDILFEFDKRHNFKTTKDMQVYMRQYYDEKEVAFQARTQGFLSERISTIFYHKYFNFSRIKIIGMTMGSPKSKVRQSIIDKFSHKNKIEVITEDINYIKIIVVLIILLILFFLIVFRIWKRINKKKEIKIKVKKRAIKPKLKRNKNVFSSFDEKSKFNI